MDPLEANERVKETDWKNFNHFSSSTTKMIDDEVVIWFGCQRSIYELDEKVQHFFVGNRERCEALGEIVINHFSLTMESAVSSKM